MDDPQAAAVEDDFLFGPNPGCPGDQVSNAEPRGLSAPWAEWTDAWTGKRLAGGQTVNAEAPIEHIPVYLRGDRPELLPLFEDHYQVPKPVPGLIEGESLKVLSKTNGRVEPQDMTPFIDQWSGDSQLVWWGGLKEGDQLVLSTGGSAGSYELELHLSKAEDYGIFKFQLDDGPVTEAMDLFERKLQPPLTIKLPPATLSEGNHRLTISYQRKTLVPGTR